MSEETLILQVVNTRIAAVIGRGGERIHALQKATGTRITVDRAQTSVATRQVTITGDRFNVSHAVKEIADIVGEGNFSVASGHAVPKPGGQGSLRQSGERIFLDELIGWHSSFSGQAAPTAEMPDEGELETTYAAVVQCVQEATSAQRAPVPELFVQLPSVVTNEEEALGFFRDLGLGTAPSAISILRPGLYRRTTALFACFPDVASFEAAAAAIPMSRPALPVLISGELNARLEQFRSTVGRVTWQSPRPPSSRGFFQVPAVLAAEAADELLNDLVGFVRAVVEQQLLMRRQTSHFVDAPSVVDKVDYVTSLVQLGPPLNQLDLVHIACSSVSGFSVQKPATGLGHGEAGWKVASGLRWSHEGEPFVVLANPGTGALRVAVARVDLGWEDWPVVGEWQSGFPDQGGDPWVSEVVHGKTRVFFESGAVYALVYTKGESEISVFEISAPSEPWRRLSRLSLAVQAPLVRVTLLYLEGRPLWLVYEASGRLWLGALNGLTAEGELSLTTLSTWTSDPTSWQRKPAIGYLRWNDQPVKTIVCVRIGYELRVFLVNPQSLLPELLTVFPFSPSTSIGFIYPSWLSEPLLIACSNDPGFPGVVELWRLHLSERINGLHKLHAVAKPKLAKQLGIPRVPSKLVDLTMDLLFRPDLFPVCPRPGEAGGSPDQGFSTPAYPEPPHLDALAPGGMSDQMGRTLGMVVSTSCLFGVFGVNRFDIQPIATTAPHSWQRITPLRWLSNEQLLVLCQDERSGLTAIFSTNPNPPMVITLSGGLMADAPGSTGGPGSGPGSPVFAHHGGFGGLLGPGSGGQAAGFGGGGGGGAWEEVITFRDADGIPWSRCQFVSFVSAAAGTLPDGSPKLYLIALQSDGSAKLRGALFCVPETVSGEFEFVREIDEVQEATLLEPDATIEIMYHRSKDRKNLAVIPFLLVRRSGTLQVRVVGDLTRPSIPIAGVQVAGAQQVVPLYGSWSGAFPQVWPQQVFVAVATAKELTMYHVTMPDEPWRVAYKMPLPAKWRRLCPVYLDGHAEPMLLVQHEDRQVVDVLRPNLFEALASPDAAPSSRGKFVMRHEFAQTTGDFVDITADLCLRRRLLQTPPLDPMSFPFERPPVERGVKRFRVA